MEKCCKFFTAQLPKTYKHKTPTFYMAQQQQGINLPGGFGGLVSYKEEYESKFMLKPTHIVGFIVLIIVFRIGLKYMFG
jgi:preprotein translocase subunit Sec61beta